MCSLFGMIDYGKAISETQKMKIIKTLSICCEERGTDATGIAFVTENGIQIKKKAVPARKFRFKLPRNTSIVMGHTRLTTQGNACYSYNNHPFLGYCENATFALAHNGMIYNDKVLRQKYGIAKTDIETDSYIAVQLIEKQRAFTVKAIKDMAETVEGSFCFTLLDEKNNLYIVKGDNPIAVFHFKEIGLYLYASTEKLLKNTIQKINFKQKYTKIDISTGEIVCFDKQGNSTKSSFEYPVCCLTHYFNTSKKERYNPFEKEYCRTYLEELIDFAENVGVSEEEVLLLFEYGFDEFEIEQLLENPIQLQCCITEILEKQYYIER